MEPYEKDPMNPILTSVPGDSYERHDPNHLKTKYYNPDSVLQKAGYGSYVELPTGEVYLVHLCARHFVPELRCTIGRETAVVAIIRCSARCRSIFRPALEYLFGTSCGISLTE